MNFHETYWLSGISVDDAGRVEDPTLCVRPCKNPIRGAQLAIVNGGTPYTSDYLYGFRPLTQSLTNLLIKSNKHFFK